MNEILTIVIPLYFTHPFFLTDIAVTYSGAEFITNDNCFK